MMNTFEHNRSIFKSINSFNYLKKQGMKHQEIQDKQNFQIHFQNKNIIK